jgi:hypothetical protein
MALFGAPLRFTVAEVPGAGSTPATAPVTEAPAIGEGVEPIDPLSPPEAEGEPPAEADIKTSQANLSPLR